MLNHPLGIYPAPKKLAGIDLKWNHSGKFGFLFSKNRFRRKIAKRGQSPLTIAGGTRRKKGAEARTEGVEGDVLRLRSVAVRLERGPDRERRAEELPVDLQALRLRVDSGLRFDGEHRSGALERLSQGGLA